MPFLPPNSFRKADLRSLLTQGRSSPQLSTPHNTSWEMVVPWFMNQGLTPEGRMVITKDPYLETTVTDWLLHFYLSANDRSLWSYIVHEFLPNHPTFAEEELVQNCVEAFTQESPEKLKKAVKLVLKTYIGPEAIAHCQFITDRKPLYATGEPNLSNPYTTGYLLAKVWETVFKTQFSVLVDQILESSISLVRLFGINNEQLRQQLDLLAQHDIIEQRSAQYLVGATLPSEQNTTSNYLVTRCWENPLELLEKAYEHDLATPNRPLSQSLTAVLDDGDEIDFSGLLSWVAEVIALDGGSKPTFRMLQRSILYLKRENNGCSAPSLVTERRRWHSLSGGLSGEKDLGCSFLPVRVGGLSSQIFFDVPWVSNQSTASCKAVTIEVWGNSSSRIALAGL